MDMDPRFGPGRGFGGARFVLENHHGGAHPLEWAIFALLLALLLMTAVSLLLPLARRRQLRPRPAFAAGPPPEAILGTRYAHGDISRDEFLRGLDDLRGTPPPAGDEAPTVERPPET